MCNYFANTSVINTLSGTIKLLENAIKETINVIIELPFI